MSFGISPSDCIKAIEIGILASRVFSEHGGYKHDYQSLVQARVALEQFNNVAKANARFLSANDTEFESINNSIDLLQVKLQALAATHSKFEKKLDANAGAGRYGSVPKKIKWGLASAGQRESLRDAIVLANTLADQLTM